MSWAETTAAPPGPYSAGNAGRPNRPRRRDRAVGQTGPRRGRGRSPPAPAPAPAGNTASCNHSGCIRPQFRSCCLTNRRPISICPLLEQQPRIALAPHLNENPVVWPLCTPKREIKRKFLLAPGSLGIRRSRRGDDYGKDPSEGLLGNHGARLVPTGSVGRTRSADTHPGGSQGQTPHATHPRQAHHDVHPLSRPLSAGAYTAETTSRTQKPSRPPPRGGFPCADLSPRRDPAPASPAPPQAGRRLPLSAQAAATYTLAP